MLNIPVLRFGEQYHSLERDEIRHFMSGEPIARVSQANTGVLTRDIKKAKRARDILRGIPAKELVEKMKKAADLYLEATLPFGDGTQSPDDFARQQSSTTGLPEHMCKGNMKKNHFVLTNMDTMLDALTRGLDLDILTRGYGVEDRGVIVSYQAQCDALGLVLPSNSPGVHTLWLPVIPLQIGLVLKPGPQEPWTPYRMAAAFEQAGIPKEVMAIYPGGAAMGAEVVNRCQRTMIFGGTPTVERYKGDPRVQVHGPGFSKVMIADDEIDNWERHVDLIADSVYLNSGRGCINCSGVCVSKNGRKIAEAIAERIGPIQALPPEDPEAKLAAFTVPGMAQAVSGMIDADLAEDGVEDMTAKYGSRLVEFDHCAYLRPTVMYCDSPDRRMASTEYMFPFVTVVECPQEQMIESMGGTLVCSAITSNEELAQELTEATHIDRLNIGAIPTIQLDWLQPHEGNIVEFLYRARAYQTPKDRLTAMTNSAGLC